jgi:putative transposase
MPRSARLDAPGVLHHVIGRGIERRKIFLQDQDRNDFLSRLASLAQDDSLKIYAWSLLPNHFHLLCKTQKTSLASSMRRLLTGYVVNFNKRHGRHGHLFQNRYKSIVCQEDLYLQELVRYIHLNLLRAGLVKDLEAFNRSAWSGHSALLGKVKRDWQETGYVLSFFGKSLAASRRNYMQFVQEGIPLGKRPDLVGGGLIRSLGGWSSVLALRRRGARQAADERILGDGEFVQSVLSEMDELEKENLRLGRAPRSLSSLAEQACKSHRIALSELRSGSRRRDIVAARQEIAQVAVTLFGYSGAEVARYLGVTTSCITRGLVRGKIPEEAQSRYLGQ